MGFVDPVLNNTEAHFRMNFQKMFITEDIEEDIILLPETEVPFKASVRVYYLDLHSDPPENYTLATEVFDLELTDPPVN